jgi:hypothetical protein
MIILLNNSKYQAELTNIRFVNGLTFDIVIKEKKTKRIMQIKEISMKLNVLNFITDLINHRKIGEQFFNNLFNLVDFSLMGSFMQKKN